MDNETALNTLTQVCEASNKAGVLNLADAVNTFEALKAIKKLIGDSEAKDRIIEELNAKI